MAPRTTVVLPLLGATLLALAAVACSGAVTAPDEQRGSMTSQQQTKKNKDEQPASSSTSSGSTAPACAYSHASSSGGGDGTGKFFCESAHNYTCATGDETLSCSCSSQNGVWAQGSCSCNGLTFAFDCNDGCSPGPAEFAKCNLPEPP